MVFRIANFFMQRAGIILCYEWIINIAQITWTLTLLAGHYG
jgi:hypothetical protein